MKTFSALLALCAGNSLVTGEIPHKGQWRGALMFFYLHLNKRLSKQSWDWWFETLSHSLWRHRNGMLFIIAVFWSESNNHLSQLLFANGIVKNTYTLYCNDRIKCLSVWYNLYHECVLIRRHLIQDSVSQCNVGITTWGLFWLYWFSYTDVWDCECQLTVRLSKLLSAETVVSIPVMPVSWHRRPN